MNQLQIKMAPHSSEQKSETTLQVQHTQEDKLDEETGQKLKADYLGQFQTDLNSFIWSSGLKKRGNFCMNRALEMHIGSNVCERKRPET